MLSPDYIGLGYVCARSASQSRFLIGGALRYRKCGFDRPSADEPSRSYAAAVTNGRQWPFLAQACREKARLLRLQFEGERPPPNRAERQPGRFFWSALERKRSSNTYLGERLRLSFFQIGEGRDDLLGSRGKVGS